MADSVLKLLWRCRIAIVSCVVRIRDGTLKNRLPRALMMPFAAMLKYRSYFYPTADTRCRLVNGTPQELLYDWGSSKTGVPHEVAITRTYLGV